MCVSVMFSSPPRLTQHETAERLEVLRRADRYERALSVKDQMLWVAMQASNLMPMSRNGHPHSSPIVLFSPKLWYKSLWISICIQKQGTIHHRLAAALRKVFDRVENIRAPDMCRFRGCVGTVGVLGA